jgi:hypothetical protein
VYPGLLPYLGISVPCDAYHTAGCGPNPADGSYCVRIEDASGALYPSDNTISGGSDYQVDGLGNGCPAGFKFDVLSAAGSGTGNRVYLDYDGVPPSMTPYEEVANSVTGAGSADYRTVIDGIAYNHLSLRDPVQECLADSAHGIGAAAQELRAALNWIHDLDVPILCTWEYQGVVVPPPEAGPLAINVLRQNEPNPFSPRTTIRFSLAEKGPAELRIYDVNGRLVRTLADGMLEAGPHQMVWDGTDDAGRVVAKGVYWDQLRAGTYSSSRKMILLP